VSTTQCQDNHFTGLASTTTTTTTTTTALLLLLLLKIIGPNNKYTRLASTHIFYPFAVETAGTWHDMAIELTQEIGRRTAITEDTRETTFLFQRLSIALRRGNAVSFHNTMVIE